MLVQCGAVRWVSDDPQPDLVEVELTDADATIWRLVDKAPIFDAFDLLGPESDYSIFVWIACNAIEQRTDSTGRETVMIDLLPWGATDQVFEVGAELLMSGQHQARED